MTTVAPVTPVAQRRLNPHAGGSDAADPSLVSVARHLMGGTVTVHLGTRVVERGGDRDRTEDGDGNEDRTRHEHERAQAEAAHVLGRIAAWAARLTRFSDASDLAALNRDRRSRVVVRPTLGAVLGWADEATAMTDGIVDVTLLDERLGAEETSTGDARRPDADPGVASIGVSRRTWTLVRGDRTSIVGRDPAVRFDLDGVAKGWLADRALALVRGDRIAVVDADGDIALRLPRGTSVTLAVAHPLDPRSAVAHLAVDWSAGSHGRAGVATSGTTVHRWAAGSRTSHHLIDPRTGAPAITDVVQATAVATTARAAEAWAKTAVIVGSEHALAWCQSGGVGVALVTDRGELLATSDLLRWLR